MPQCPTEDRLTTSFIFQFFDVVVTKCADNYPFLPGSNE